MRMPLGLPAFAPPAFGDLSESRDASSRGWVQLGSVCRLSLSPVKDGGPAAASLARLCIHSFLPAPLKSPLTGPALAPWPAGEPGWTEPVSTADSLGRVQLILIGGGHDVLLEVHICRSGIPSTSGTSLTHNLQFFALGSECAQMTLKRRGLEGISSLSETQTEA